MDLKALEYTRDHYNRHALQHADTREALHARATGASAPLKKFHNSIKRKLIEKYVSCSRYMITCRRISKDRQSLNVKYHEVRVLHHRRFAWGADTLLDFACGRGGDIWKWIDSQIKYVKGIDLSPGEIEEARRRYKEAITKHKSNRNPALITRCEFMDTPKLGIEEWKEPRQYDVVTCMFALHYFFVSEAALKRFLHNVSLNLKDGGYFIGTVPDGKRINECIRSSKSFKSPMLTIEARWEGNPATFGSAYVCAIGDTVTGGEKGTEGSLEYLVYRNVLQGVAAQFGLKPVLRYGDAELEAMFDSADADQLLKHFKPHFPQCDPSLERASALFAAFAFQKTHEAVGKPPVAGEGKIAAFLHEGNDTVKSTEEEHNKKRKHKGDDSDVEEKEEEKECGGGDDGAEKKEDKGGNTGGNSKSSSSIYKRPQIRRKLPPPAQ